MKKNNHKQVIRFFLVQLLIVLIVSIVALNVSGTKAFYSAVLGGLVCILPNLFFAILLFKNQGARAAKKIVSGFYKGEAIKIVLSIVLFAVVFIMCEIVPIVFFVTYILVQLSFWFAPLILTK